MSGIEMRTLKLRDRLFFVRLTFTVRRWMKRDARVLLRSVNTSRADFLRLFGRLVTRPRTRKLLPDWTAAGTPRRLVSRGFFGGARVGSDATLRGGRDWKRYQQSSDEHE